MTGRIVRGRKALEEDHKEFKLAYWEERRKSDAEYIDARILPLTGLILNELERAGLAERNGVGFKPLPWTK